VISYATRGLSKSEKNYSTHKLEFLALKWAVTEKFHDYLYGTHFKVFKDSNPLTYVLTSAELVTEGSPTSDNAEYVETTQSPDDDHGSSVVVNGSSGDDQLSSAGEGEPEKKMPLINDSLNISIICLVFIISSTTYSL